MDANGFHDTVNIGCCGFSQARLRYFTNFPVVEVQKTFYEPPAAELAAKWRETAPPGFQFCMKAWQLVTHAPSSPTYRKLKSPVSPSERDLLGWFRPTEQVWLAWERTEAIARALDARVILFQCPASFDPAPANIRNFRAFFSRVRRERRQLAWEPRGNWPAALVRELCAEFDLIHCVDPFDANSVYGDTVYWRLHGRGGYRYRYSDEELGQLKERCLACLAAGRKPVYVLFNNMSMTEDALRFGAMLQPERRALKP